MSRYVVERDFPHGLHVPLDAAGAITEVRVLDPYFYLGLNGGRHDS